MNVEEYARSRTRRNLLKVVLLIVNLKGNCGIALRMSFAIHFRDLQYVMFLHKADKNCNHKNFPKLLSFNRNWRKSLECANTCIIIKIQKHNIMHYNRSLCSYKAIGLTDFLDNTHLSGKIFIRSYNSFSDRRRKCFPR